MDRPLTPQPPQPGDGRDYGGWRLVAAFLFWPAMISAALTFYFAVSLADPGRTTIVDLVQFLLRRE